METLGDALPKEQARVREVLGYYKEIGTVGMFGATMIEQSLKDSDKAVMSGDLLRCCELMKTSKVLNNNKEKTIREGSRLKEGKRIMELHETTSKTEALRLANQILHDSRRECPGKINKIIKDSLEIKVKGRKLQAFGYSVSDEGILTTNIFGKIMIWVICWLPGGGETTIDRYYGENESE